jgi:hypothetical protein
VGERLVNLNKSRIGSQDMKVALRAAPFVEAPGTDLFVPPVWVPRFLDFDVLQKLKPPAEPRYQRNRDRDTASRKAYQDTEFVMLRSTRTGTSLSPSRRAEHRLLQTDPGPNERKITELGSGKAGFTGAPGRRAG